MTRRSKELPRTRTLTNTPPGDVPTGCSFQAAPRHIASSAECCFRQDLTWFTVCNCTGPDAQRSLSGSDPTDACRGTGFPPCCSGLQVQGTAISPLSAANWITNAIVPCCANESKLNFHASFEQNETKQKTMLRSKALECIVCRDANALATVAGQCFDERYEIRPLLFRRHNAGMLNHPPLLV